ncbi:hypothetical protein [Clostridium thailandense]|uniref:hypothetical protein n=1 Tax=Clostridium thailandense TaxID=2794346 RepID=UPI0039896EEA
MKKVASIVAITLVTCSLSACGNRNTSFRNPSVNQGGANIGLNQGSNPQTTTTYKDGVYIGEGNKTATGTEAAVVTITGGRISNVILKTLDTHGKEITSNTQTSTGKAGTAIGSNMGGAAISTPGENTSGTDNNTNIHGTNGGSKGSVTSGTISGTGGGRANGTASGNLVTGGATGGATDGTTINGTTAGGNAVNDYERVRANLAATIIQNQTTNVTIADVGNSKNAVDNWKLAVNKALDISKR